METNKDPSITNKLCIFDGSVCNLHPASPQSATCLLLQLKSLKWAL